MSPRAFGFSVLLLSSFLSFVPSISRAAMSGGEIRQCDQMLEQFRKQAMSTSGTMVEKRRVLGHMQKSLFTLHCKDHPQAKARVSEAEAMMRGNAAPKPAERPSGSRSKGPEKVRL